MSPVAQDVLLDFARKLARLVRAENLANLTRPGT